MRKRADLHANAYMSNVVDANDRASRRVGLLRVWRLSWCLPFLSLAGCSLYTDELLNGAHRMSSRDAASDASRPVDPPPPSDEDAGGGGTADHALPPDAASSDVDADTGRGSDAVISDRSVADQADRAVPDIIAPDAPADADPPRYDAEASAPDAEGGLRDADAGGATDVADVKVTVDADAGSKLDAGCVGSTMHDEDGDGVVDSCDNCPSVANANQADLGELNAGGSPDGVGDACDPRPSNGGDSILLFDPFTSGQIGSEWQVYGGTWQAGSDTIAETATGTVQELDRVGFGSTSDYLVETLVTLDALPTSDSRATLVFRMNPSSHNGWGCAVMKNVLIFSAITDGEAGESNPPSVAIPAPQVGSRYRIQTGGYGSNLYCMLPSSGHKVPRSNSSYPSGVPGLRSYAAASTFTYLLVYRLGGPIP
jgi:hypothetical protein